jgi:hypothetical protein
MAIESMVAASEEVVRGRWPELENPLFRLLLRRWAAWREGAVVPRRAAVVPSEIVPCLPQLWIFRLADDNSRVVCSLAGEQLNQDWGFSIMGKDPMALWGPEVGAIVNARLKRVALTPGVIYGRSNITPRTGAAGAMYAERLMLPLGDDSAQPYGAMGITVFHRNRLLDDPQVVPPSQQAWLYPCYDLPAELPPA